MSYMQKPCNIVSDGENIHISMPHEAGTCVPISIMEEFVVMFHAEMGKKRVEQAERRALKKYNGCFGCDAISKKHGRATCVETIESMSKSKE